MNLITSDMQLFIVWILIYSYVYTGRAGINNDTGSNAKPVNMVSLASAIIKPELHEREAPWVRNFVNPPIREILVITWPYAQPTVRPPLCLFSVHDASFCYMRNNKF